MIEETEKGCFWLAMKLIKEVARTIHTLSNRHTLKAQNFHDGNNKLSQLCRYF